jgi:RNA polymerase sigma-70 factor (ECF subfamily)
MINTELTNANSAIEETYSALSDRTLFHDSPRLDQLDEFDLITATLSGDHEAFEALIRPHLHIFTIGIHRILQDPQDTQEALQEAILSIHSELNRFTGRNRFFAWAYRICLHEGLMLRRSRISRREPNVEMFMPMTSPQGPLQRICDPALQRDETA